MKRSITRWTTALATAALLGLPVAAAAKTQQPSAPPPQQQPAPQPTEPQQPQPAPQPTQPQPAQPQPTQPQPAPPAQPQPAQPQPTDPQPTAPPATTQQPTASSPAASTGTDQSVSPEDHLRQARAALSDIKTTSIPARERAQFAELRRHLNALDKPASAPSTRSTARKGAATSASGDASWGTEVAAIDRIITNLAGSDTATATSGAGATSTTGTAGASQSRGAAATAVDDATRAKLMEIRTHITAYAAAKSGASSSSPRADASSSMAKETMSSTSQSGGATAGETPRTGNYSTPDSSTPASAAGQQSPTSNPDSPAGQQPPAAAQGTSPAAGQTSAAGAPAVNAEAAHRSLLAARDALNQLTQLPAAAQLGGEARTQVQQLITNFNELITNNTDWRASYTKVASTLAALLGPDNTDAEATAGAPTTATGAAGTTGAVGTAGGTTVQIDPAIRAKLVEMRNSLNDFQKASGGIGK